MKVGERCWNGCDMGFWVMKVLNIMICVKKEVVNVLERSCVFMVGQLHNGVLRMSEEMV